ncbi:Dnaj-domain transmembrane-like protein [Leishmania tarentolae]|uniref:Dnaj-domain transmembrane-like protein n=1 Tax=Leishmania tarentolae TaxID=5689 RepID=A0A640K8T1_LEITA|nr:Dnaj-domain transmembrane-like protein [Leishmania tarentolae]
MSSIFMGPYPTRFSRLRCCTAAVEFSASARGTDATATIATTTTTTDAAAAASAALVAVPPPPPRLCALHTMRKITNTPMQRQSVADALYFISSSSIAPTPSSLPMLSVGVAAADALNSLSLQTAPVSTQLAKLPVRVLTQLVQWRQSRNCCASVLTSVVGDDNLYGSHSCMLSARTPRRGLAARLRFSIRWTAAMKASEAAANTQPTATPLVLLAPASPVSPASSCGAAQSIVSGSAAASADSSSTGAAVSTPVGSLYTVRRCYSSAASADGPTAATASASSTPQPEDAAVQAALDSAAGNSEYSGQRSEERETRAANSSSSVHERVTEEEEKGKGGFEAVAVPSFAEIYWAFRTLQLVQDDDRVVREWTAAHVKQAYRTLAKQLHPDVAGGDDELMERVNTSYELLMDMSTELADNYRMWLETGGEAELQLQCAQDEQELLGSRWRSREVEQLMMVGWCATLSGFVMYAVWRTLYSTSPVVNSVGSATAIGGSASSGCSKVHCNIKVAGVHPIGTRLTLPRAGITVSTAAGVQYGVVSMGDSVLWMRPHLSFQLLQRVRRAVSRYALTLALTLATWMNSVMLQHAFQRMLVGGSGEAAR